MAKKHSKAKAAKTSLAKINSRESLQTISIETINSIDEKVNRIWKMYETQLQRNIDLMTYIDKMHEAMQKLIATPTLATIIPQPPLRQQLPIQSTENSSIQIPPIPLDKQKRLSENYKRIFDTSTRLDGIHNILNILQTLAFFNDFVQPEKISMLTGIASSSCYRIFNRLRDLKLIENHIGTCKISAIGRDFIEEMLTSKEEYSKRKKVS